jgi:hypothetical protein
MNIQYRWVDWKFNDGLWAQCVREMVDAHGVDFVAEVMGVKPTSVTTWGKMKGSAYADYPYPRMTNFIKFCNEFNIDPREFWILED